MTTVPAVSAPEWYLAQLKPGGFSRAVENLRRQDFETFMPMRQVTRRRTGRLVSAAEPLFPGYLFVGLAEGRSDWRVINSTYGVARLVALEGDRPTLVPAGFIEALSARTDAEGFLAPEEQLRPGDRVRVVDGPFAHSIAEIEAIPAKERVFALIEMMGRRVRAELDPSDVERL